MSGGRNEMNVWNSVRAFKRVRGRLGGGHGPSTGSDQRLISLILSMRVMTLSSSSSSKTFFQSSRTIDSRP